MHGFTTTIWKTGRFSQYGAPTQESSECGLSVLVLSRLMHRRLDVITNQPALQVSSSKAFAEMLINARKIYSCNGIFNPDLPIPRKAAHGGPLSSYPQHSCLVIEQESWLDAINNPEFPVDQIYGPTRPYNWEATYVFSVLE